MALFLGKIKKLMLDLKPIVMFLPAHLVILMHGESDFLMHTPWRPRRKQRAFHLHLFKSPIIVVWPHGEPVIDPVLRNNNGDMLVFIPFYYAERPIIQPIPILYETQNKHRPLHANGLHNVRY